MNILIYICFQQVKQIEKSDSVLTSKQQIDRLTRPGATYFNLNPFDVSTIKCGLIIIDNIKGETVNNSSIPVKYSILVFS